MSVSEPAPESIDDASPPGYHGRYLRVDATTGQARWQPIAETVLRRFVGGSGLGAHLLLEEGAAETDPLAADAPLAFVFSPLVGSPLTTSAKFAVVAKSPLTDRFNDSLASSRFAIDGKKTGGDALVIVGRAESPVVLVVDDDEVRWEPAADLWGATIGEAQQRLRQRLGPSYSFAVIGPAGERLIRYATISHDGRHAGRGGHGAVLGAKRIKAVAVRGTRRTAWADPGGLVAAAKDLSERSFGPATAKYRELGTAANLLVFNRLSALPTRNFQRGRFDEADQLSPQALAVGHARTRASCAACTIGCEHIYELTTAGDAAADDGGSTIPHDGVGVRVEYENLFALGSLCGVGDSSQVLAASRLCDELGIDTISAGGTIAFAMECVERGLLAEPWLRFGDGEAVLRAIELIGRRDGVGDQLAGGSRAMAAGIGQGSEAFAAHVKGLELPGYEPRALQTMALGLAVGTRGADHNRSGAYEADFSPGVDRRAIDDRAPHLAIETEDKAAVMDSLILCKFLRGVFDDFYSESARTLELVTGWDVTADELRGVAGRVVTARKWFNIRAGWTPAEDRLPSRFLEQPLADDPHAALDPARLHEAIHRYNQLRGWTPDGHIPPPLLSHHGFGAPPAPD